MLIPVILSGGSGTRLWPLSRELYPKQFLPLVGRATMLQDTVARLAGLGAEGPVVVCNEQHRFIVAEQLRQVGQAPSAIVLEPVGRNTAPAIGVAALTALKRFESVVSAPAVAEAVANARPARRATDLPSVPAEAVEEPVLLVMPADHVLKDVKAFQTAVRAGLAAAREGKLVAFGIVPTKPETGFGYIRKGAGAGPAVPIAQFVEKPNVDRAAEYVASGEYLWNSGMFMFRARRYLEELERFAPEMLKACQLALASASQDLDFTRLSKDAFAACPSDSIDYAVMEKTQDAVVVPLDAGWSDVGSWSALHESVDADANGNATYGDVIAEDSHGSYLYSSHRLVATVGLRDHVVVETKDAVFVAPKDRAQDVKTLVARLKKDGRGETTLHREVFRPWGSYDSVDDGARFQVKRLMVKPGATLSLQMHHHRAEHWIVVEGTARITCNDKVFLLSENESTYIPVGATHRIENPGKVPLHIIEVQSGSYLGEDDIVRFEDSYGRKGTNT
jgi:mannose-1-phosphate guanylyltransferase/mannose-6-phosphate isomerase